MAHIQLKVSSRYISESLRLTLFIVARTIIITINNKNFTRFIKDNMILNVTNFIINTGHDWTITDSNSIIAQKNYLKNQLSTALQKPSGELQLIDDMMFRLEMEERELIKNVKKLFINNQIYFEQVFTNKQNL
jgi:3-dehydroquinate synthase class II